MWLPYLHKLLVLNYGCLSQTKKLGVFGPTAIMCVSWLGGWTSKRFFFTHCDMARFDGDLRDIYTVYVHNMYVCVYIYMDHQQYDLGFLVNMVIPQLMAICKCCQSAG